MSNYSAAFVVCNPLKLSLKYESSRLRGASTKPCRLYTLHIPGRVKRSDLQPHSRKPIHGVERADFTMGLVVRTADEGDISAVDSLLSRSYPILLKDDYPDELLEKALPLIAHAQPGLVTCGTYYVAERDGLCVGAGGWTFQVPTENHSEPGRANVRHLVTDALHVRKGIGRALMAHVLKEARAAGATWIHCMSTRTAEPFYAAMGFKTICQIEVPLRPDLNFPAVEMRLDL